MGKPSSGCAPVQSPMTPLPRHRHSLSISSLPQDTLAKVHCEKRASVSAVSSPAKGVPLSDIQKLTIATFLGHGKAKSHHDFSRRRAPSGAEDLLQLKRAIEHATAGDRKTIQSFNPFRGHRRDSASASFTTSTSTEFSSRSAPPSKNHGVGKIAGSSFHTIPTEKQESSMSLPRAASQTKTDCEVITPASNMEGKSRISCDSYVTMDIDQESPRTISSVSTQQKISDITNILENEIEAELQAVDDSHWTTEELEPPRSRAVSMRRSCKTIAEIGIQIPPSSPHEEERGHDEYIAALFDDDDDVIDNLVTEETDYREVTDTGVQCSLSSEEEEEEEEYFSDASEESLVAVPSEANSSDMEVVPVVIRKRRRSVSASGIGAMMLKVVRVADSAQMVTSTRRASKPGSPEKMLFGVEALRARQYVLEKTAQFSLGPHAFEERSSSAHSTPARACRPESEDATKSTYSKFVGIEIDSGGHCIELVQPSTDAQLDGAGSPIPARQRSRQATPGSSPSPSHLHYQANINCTTQQRTRQTTPGSSPSPSHLHYRASSNSRSRQATPGSSPSPSHLHYHTSSNYIQERSRNSTPGTSPSPSHLHYHASSNSRSRNATPVTSPSPSHLHYHASSNFRSRQVSPESSPSLASHLPYHNCPVHQGTPNDKVDIQTKDSSPVPSPAKQTDIEGHSSGKPTANPTSIKSEKRTLQECFKTVGYSDSNTDKVPLHTNSRTIVSRLQAPPSGAFSRVDVYLPGASTVSILSNPSFSSSHQDRLWEEQADIYSSGGRGTPGRDEEPNFIINLRKNPLQHYEGEEEVSRRRASPESGHFVQQFMSKVRGSMSPQRRARSPQRRAGLPPRPGGLEKRRNTWSSCMCFSVK